MKTIIFIIALTFLVGCGSGNSYAKDEQNNNNSFELLNTIDISSILSPNGGGVGRPDVIAIEDELYLAYSILTERNHHLIKLEADMNITMIGSPVELYSGTHDFSVDIRVSKANNKLWYAFEDNKYGEVLEDTHFLNAAWYDDSHNLIGQQTDIAIGLVTTIPSAFSVNPNDITFSDPEATDDPTPFYHNSSYYIFTRAWSGWIDEYTTNSKHHIRVFDEYFNKTDDFILDLSSIIPNKTLSQNTLIDINNQIYLIGGFYNKRNDIQGGSAIYAIPLSNDLKTTNGDKITLIDDAGQWFFKTTAAKIYNGYMYLLYSELLSGKSTQNIAIFDVNNNFNLIKRINVSSAAPGEITANHATFEIISDKLYIFYPEADERIFVKIFSL